jgi:hypothetical protein
LEHYNNKIRKISLYLIENKIELIRIKNLLLEKQNTDVLLMGPNETCLRRNMETLGVEANAYFGGETNLVGNYWQIILNDYRDGHKFVLAFLESHPELYRIHDKLWEKTSEIQKEYV